MRLAVQVATSLVLGIVYFFIAAAALDWTGLMRSWGFWHGGFGMKRGGSTKRLRGLRRKLYWFAPDWRCA